MADVNGAGPVSAQLAVPAVTVSCHPGINPAGDEMNSRYQQQPGDDFPSRQRQSRARPGVHPGMHSSRWIDRLHQAQCLFATHLRKARRNARVVQIEQLNAAAAVDSAQARHARAAKPAIPIVEYSQAGHNVSNLVYLTLLVGPFCRVPITIILYSSPVPICLSGLREMTGLLHCIEAPADARP